MKKNEFLLAFNEICEQRGLSREVVIDALKTALVSAYRRNTNVSNTQQVTVEIDPRTGEPTIYAEKETVDSIFDNRTEVLLDEAHRAGFVDAELGDMVMMDSTPANFGRIAAQTAKQVILQRVREAEREHLYDEFASREGEIINGTVQSVSGQNITIGLGRTEALLPRSQQVPGERYRPHDKIRVYLLEVRRTNRGPQIFVSRNHRNLLRRLLELEVPEIYNGQVDIKSIAREAGARSKVAVVALQAGVDPVGACVGMRGVRIQSIVRELNDEKIDVIEWDPDQRNFIAKALSPARVSQVFLEEHPDNGKTAAVIVPDDQLSLAIGREGQNARLAAKLTGWRIDIKSLTEAAGESLDNLDHPAVEKAISGDTNLVEQVTLILEKKAANRPITAEDYSYLNRIVSGVEGRIIEARAAEYDELRKARAAAQERVSDAVWDAPVDDLDITEYVAELLTEGGINTVGDILYRIEVGDEQMLEISGIGEKTLADIREAVTAFQAEIEAAEAAAAEAAAAEAAAAAAVDGELTEAEADELEAEAVGLEAVDVPATVVEPAAVEAEAVEEPVLAEVTEEKLEVPETVAVAEADAEAVAAAEDEAEEEEEDGVVGLKSAVQLKPKPSKKAPPKIVVVPRTDEEEEEEDSSGRRSGRRKGKQLIFDENAGRVVVKRKRKRQRQTPAWEEFDDTEFDF